MIVPKDLEAATIARRSVLAEHSELRRMLDDVDALVKRFDEGSDEVGEELRERAMSLYERFEAHLDSEEATLLPPLRDAGADGVERAERLLHEHREQRELLRYLVGRLEEQSNPTLLIARELRNFSEVLRADMLEEDKLILVEELLGPG